jgi:hypothetical protein
MKTINLSAVTTEYDDGCRGALRTLVKSLEGTPIEASVLFESLMRNGEFILSIDIAIPEGEGYGTVVNVVIRENGGVEVVQS